LISRNTIETVFETARVEEVIGDFVQLKRSGSNLKGLSPFSDEKSPSFMVSPVKQIWKDFSSGKGGNAVTFLMEHEHFTFPEAIKFLAKKYNIEIEEIIPSDELKAATNEKESMYVVSEFANTYFVDSLWNTEPGKAIGLSYFKERGFTTETIKKFSLGYSPDNWDAFTNAALEKSFSLEYLEKTGLTIVKDDKKFDRFKGRVMFPIQSMSGRILGFGGRILTQDKKAAKYVNSPESDIYHKSKVLYGIFHAKQAIAKEDKCFLVEGYTDVIQFHQAGIQNVVASSGTALTPDQIRLINRLTKNITVLFDGDAAGLRASIRGIDLILEEGMNVKVCSFPEGEDPDSFAKKTPYTSLVDYLDTQAKDFIQFKASLLMQEAKQDPIKKADLIRDMVVSISKIPDRIKREIYIQECSRIMDISEDVLFNTLAQIVQKDIKEIHKKNKQEQQVFDLVKQNNHQSISKVDVLSILESSILKMLLLYGHYQVTFDEFFVKIDEHQQEVEVVEKVSKKIYEKIYLSLQEDEIEFANPIFSALYIELINHFQQGGSIDKNAILNQLNPDHSAIISDILMQDEKHQLHGWQEKKQVFVKEKDDVSILARMVVENLASFREYLINKLNEELMKEITKEDANSFEILSTINDYNRLRTSISRRLGRIRSTFI
jgi:DNA primase